MTFVELCAGSAAVSLRLLSSRARPPYEQTTGYGATLPRPDVLTLAARWQAAGCVVAVSEAEPLPLPGWHAHSLPRPHGVVRSWSRQQAEYLTISREPRGQLALLGGAP